MATLLKKENINVVIEVYQDRNTGQEKKKRRTIGEIVTMQGDDGSVFQFGEIWGPHGSTKFDIYEQQDNQQQQAPQSQPQPGYGQTQQYAAPQPQMNQQPQYNQQQPVPPRGR